MEEFHEKNRSNNQAGEVQYCAGRHDGDGLSGNDRYGKAEFAIIMPATFATRALVKADGIRL